MARDPDTGETWDRAPSEPGGTPLGGSQPGGSQPGGKQPRGSQPERSGPAFSGPAGSAPPPEGAHGAPRPSGGPDDGRYVRDGVLGRGGMGVVYLARDQRLDRPVALKEAARGGEVAARLAREARVTAGLDHPSIVTVHDCGLTAEGRPFYTMRLLRGRPLSTVLADAKGLEGRLALLRHYLDACNAVAYAHTEGVLHRDLKPANIMIGDFGETQVVDWGLATRVDAAPTEPPRPPSSSPAWGPATDTRTGAVLGTPAYMSPEQARGETVGTASDVWSLGAILYELLSGNTPRARGSSDEVLARARRGEIPSLRGLPAPPELLAIAERALAPDVRDRYPSAASLAEDMAAYLDGRRVEAHRYTPWELLTRLVRAWRAPLAVGTLALLALAALAAGGTWRLKRERDRVVVAEQETRGALHRSDESLARALVAEARSSLRQGSTAAAAVLASRAIGLGDQPDAWGILAATSVAPRAERLSETMLPSCAEVQVVGEDDVLCIRSDGVRRIVQGVATWTHAGAPRWARIDGDRVLLDERDRRAISVSLLTGAPSGEAWYGYGSWSRRAWAVRGDQWPGRATNMLPVLDSFCPGSVYSRVASLPSTGEYAVACDDGRVGSGPAGQLPDRYLPTPATYAAFAGLLSAELTSDGQTLLLGGTRGDLLAVDLRTGESHQAVTAARDATWLLRASPDGRLVAVGSDRGDVELRELPGLALLTRVPAAGVKDVAFAADGTLLVASGGTLSRWRLPLERAASVLTSDQGVTAAIYSPDGRHLATAHGGARGQIWSLPDGLPTATLDLGGGTGKGAAFTPDSTVAWFANVAPGSGGQRPRAIHTSGTLVPEIPTTLLDEVTRAAGIEASGSFGSRRVAILRTGALLAPSYVPGVFLVMDARTRAAVPLEGCPSIEWFDLGQSPGGEHAVLVGDGGLVTVVDPGPPARCGTGWTIAGAGSADVDASGTRIVVSTDDALALYDATGAPLWSVPSPARVLDVSISADGRWIATGNGDHDGRLWDGATGALRAVLPGHTERVASVDFRPDGRQLATGSWDGTVRLWDLDVLDQKAADIAATAETRWGLTLASALDGAGR